MKTQSLLLFVVPLILAILFPLNAAFGGIPNVILWTQSYHFSSGGVIPITGNSILHNSTITISLVTKFGDIENTTQTKSDGMGRFNATLGVPKSAYTGTWYLFAKSNAGEMSQEIRINTDVLDSTPSNFPSGLPPLKQWRLGLLPNINTCDGKSMLVIKAEDGLPACVRYTTGNALVERGWAKLPPSNMTVFATNITIPLNSSEIFRGMTFMPQTVKVVVGTNNTIRWINMDGVVNDITSDTGAFQSRLIEPGYAWIHTFDEAGDYGYHSNIHPWLKGRVIVIPNPLANDTGIVTMGNQKYYFETPYYDAHLDPVQISFHDVNFTLFPGGSRGGPPIPCNIHPPLYHYYWTDAKFRDNTHELLYIFVEFSPCSSKHTTSMFSNHTNPQAGLTFYDGKMKLLVSTDVSNSTQDTITASTKQR